MAQIRFDKALDYIDRDMEAAFEYALSGRIKEGEDERRIYRDFKYRLTSYLKSWVKVSDDCVEKE